jgi:hypothetical protein
MAMELWVLSDKKLNSIAEWQSAIDAEGFALQLSDGAPFGELNGFLPADLRGQPTGFECNHWPASAFMHEIHEMLGIDFGHDWKYVLAFRWRGDFNELRAAWIAGTAYAQATGGIVFDDQEGKVRNAGEAREVARVEYETPDPNLHSVVDKVLRDLKLGPYRET